MRKNNLYDPHLRTPFKLSRSKIDLYLECPKCFYLDRRLGVSRPSMPGFSLNSAVDLLLKREFDLLRKDKKPHQLMRKYSVDAIPYAHPDLDKWRENFVGASYHHPETNFLVTGAIDDIWEKPDGQLIIVDYKSTSTKAEISLEDYYRQGYKKQLEVYQWIFKKMGFPVSSTGYFVYANAGKDRDRFDGKLEFHLTLIPYRGDNSWVEPSLRKIKELLDCDKIPSSGQKCEYCQYTGSLTSFYQQQNLL